MLNKSLVTNSIAFLLTVFGAYSPYYPNVVFNVGLFAFSGAITNWLAVYMLFEKVPLLHGSGVIPNRFEEFKSGIRELIMSQFFTADNIEKFMATHTNEEVDLTPVLAIVNYDQIFDSLLETVKSSSFGAMLGMFSGPDALLPLKEPFQEKMQQTLNNMVSEHEFKAALGKTIGNSLKPDDLENHIGSIVDSRLEELTPKMVKEIIQDMIRKHLGWLVVWGGVFGGMIGLTSALIL